MSNILFLKAPTGANASQKQLEAGNYKMTHKVIRGLKITIENPKGSVRSGVDRDGHEWKTHMHCAYGYIRGSMGVDGDHVDVYLGPDEEAEFVYVVHQRKAGDWKKFDEDKVMLQFSTEEKAKNAYLKQYDDKRFLGPVTKMPFDEFKKKAYATKDKPVMIKGVNMNNQSKVLFFKSYVKPHARKLANGRTINIGGYNNKKLAHDKGKDSKTKDMFDDKDKKVVFSKPKSSSDVKNIKEGDTVKLKPEYMDEGEAKLVYVATDDMEKGRVSVQATNSGLGLPPVNTVHDYMIEGYPDKKSS